MKKRSWKVKDGNYDPIVGFRAPFKFQKMLFELQGKLGLSKSEVLKLSVKQAYDTLKAKNKNSPKSDEVESA